MPLTIEEQERQAYTAHTHRQVDYDLLFKGEAVSSIFLGDYEIQAGFPSESFLQDLIDKLKLLASRRVTKESVAFFVTQLEDRQSEIASAAEFGKEELEKLDLAVRRLGE
jgi:hypothetical protein